MIKFIFKPYKSVGTLLFKDTYSEILNKLNNYQIFESYEEVIDRKYPRILVIELYLMINFNEDKESIRFFEFLDNDVDIDVVLNDISLFKSSYKVLERKISELDKNIEIDESGFKTNDFGFEVSRKLINNKYTDKIETLLLFSDKYNEESEIDLNELYRSITGKELNL